MLGIQFRFQWFHQLDISLTVLEVTRFVSPAVNRCRTVGTRFALCVEIRLVINIRTRMANIGIAQNINHD